jgi:hypothetical protein
MAQFSKYLSWIYAAILLAIIVLAALSISGAFTHDYNGPNL